MAAFAFRANQTEGIDALAVASENSLVQSLGEAFFLTGSVDTEQLPDTLEVSIAPSSAVLSHHSDLYLAQVIRVAFEDGGASDEVITEACQHAEHALVDFLLAVVCSDRYLLAALMPAALTCSSERTQLWLPAAWHSLAMSMRTCGSTTVLMLITCARC